MMEIYVDSNIFVDAEIDSEPHHKESKLFFDSILPRQDIRICTSVYTLLEIASAVTRQVGSRETPYRYLYNVQVKYKEGQVSWLPPLKKEDDMPSLNFEKFVRILIDVCIECHTPSGDTIHAQAMLEHGIKTIITRNGRDFKGLKDIEVLTPEEFLAKLH